MKLNLKYMISDEVFVLEQPKESIITLVVINQSLEKPLSALQHDNLELLRSRTGLFFIFLDELLDKNVSREKFSNLYRAKAWLNSGKGNFGKNLFKCIEYIKEIFSKHYNVLITDLSGLDNVSSQEMKTCLFNAIKVGMTRIARPIMKISRLDPVSFFSIYYDPNSITEEKSFLSNFFNIKEEKKIGPEVINMFCNNTSSSPIVMIRSEFIDIILNFKDNDTRDYIETFKERLDFRYLIASLIKYLGVEVIDEDITKLNLGDYKNDKKSSSEGTQQ